MNKNDRIIHNNFGSGTIIDIRLYPNPFPYLVRFDFELNNLIWCREQDLTKVKIYIFRRNK